MTARRGKSFSILQRAIGLLVVLGLAWLALRNAAVALLAPVQPSMALSFWPPSGEAFAQAANASAASPPEQLALAREALRRSPLSSQPFAAAASAAMAQDDPVRATEWLEQAVVRNSRQSELRARLYHLYWMQGRWSEGIDEGVALAGLRSAMADGIYQSFLVLLGDTRGRAILARKLQRRSDGTRPHWGARLVGLSAERPEGRQLRALLDRADGLPSTSTTNPSEDSYLAWVASLPPTALPHVRGVYDGHFHQLPGETPFNWALDPASAEVHVERGPDRRGGTLVARTGGLTERVMARQVLVLPPGSYRLAVNGATPPASSPMTWRISCLSGVAIADLPIPETADAVEAERRFVVPGGCGFQELALVGSGGSASRTRRIEVTPIL